MATPPPRWSREELERDSARAVALFRHERLAEPLEQYLAFFDQYQAAFEDLLAKTLDLTDLRNSATDLLVDPKRRDVFRYLAGPIISEDDLEILAEASLSAQRLKRDPSMVLRVVDTVVVGLDRRRFPWVAEERPPTLQERAAAILASASLMANNRAGTSRRNLGKQAQEGIVRQKLLVDGFEEVPRRKIETFQSAPEAGTFCLESRLGSRKADLVVRLRDGRLMPIECKVSNSAVNSVKRLNNDAAAKAEAWIKDFGQVQVVPVAVLSGVFKLHNLEDAQRRGLTLFWAHDLEALTQWAHS